MSSESPDLRITYWGVTGTFPAPLLPSEMTDRLVDAIGALVTKGQLHDLKPGADLETTIRDRVTRELPFHLRSTFGGNTTCVEVETPDGMFIFDCGSGFRELGASLALRWAAEGSNTNRPTHVFVTHAHMDHTFATPFFIPYYNPKNLFTIWGSQTVLDSLAAVLDPQSAMSRLYFPPTFADMKSTKIFRAVEVGAEVVIGETRVRTFALNHPGGCLAYRLERRGKVFVFATDHEQVQVPDEGLCAFARDADLLYTEGQYTQEEYEGRVGVGGDRPIDRRGWGHSSIEASVSTAIAAGVRCVHIGHRDPRRTDRANAELEKYLLELVEEGLKRGNRPLGSCIGLIPYEGLTVSL